MIKYKNPFIFDDKISFWKCSNGYYCMQNSNCKVIKLSKKQSKELDLENEKESK